MVDYSKYVREVGFEVVEDIGEGHVFKASKNGLLVTVKIGVGCSFSSHQVATENKVLDKVKGIDGIVEKLSFYLLRDNTDEVGVLVKRYIEGKRLYSYKENFDKDVLVRAVKASHKSGIANLDLHGGNIIIDPSQKPWLIDFGVCHFKEDGRKEFKLGRKRDLRILKNIVKYY